jgi:hypothetical protein
MTTDPAMGPATILRSPTEAVVTIPEAHSLPHPTNNWTAARPEQPQGKSNASSDLPRIMRRKAHANAPYHCDSAGFACLPLFVFSAGRAPGCLGMGSYVAGLAGGSCACMHAILTASLGLQRGT